MVSGNGPVLIRSTAPLQRLFVFGQGLLQLLRVECEA